LEGLFELSVTEFVRELAVEEVESFWRSKTLFAPFKAFMDRSFPSEQMHALEDDGIEVPDSAINPSLSSGLNRKLGSSSKIIRLC